MHSHILWKVDDGPTTLEETLELLQYAVNEGISQIISTSHYNHPYYDVNDDVINNQINILQQMISEHNIPLTIHTGQEVRLFENMISSYYSKKIYFSELQLFTPRITFKYSSTIYRIHHQ